MPIAAAIAEHLPTAWLLTSRATQSAASSARWPLRPYAQREILSKVKLYSYTNTAYELEHLHGRSIAFHILRDYFDIAFVRGYTLDLEVQACELVHEKCFPLAWSMLDDAYNCGEDPFSYPLPYESWGIAWEMDDGTGQYEYAIPLLVALSHAIELQSDWQEEHVEAMVLQLDMLYDAIKCNGFHGDLTSWSLDGGSVRAGVRQMRERFSQLDAPFDGLAPLSHALLHDRDNVFLDMPRYWRADYEYSVMYWGPWELDHLTKKYDEVKEEIAKLEAYMQWYESTPDAQIRVCEVIEGVLATLDLE